MAHLEMLEWMDVHLCMSPEQTAQVKSFAAGAAELFDSLIADLRFISAVPRNGQTAAPQDRANFRTFLAIVEALSNFIRSQALFLDSLGHKGLDGKLRTKLDPAAWLNPQDNLKISFRAIAALKNPTLPTLDLCTDPGWADFVLVTKVRDRLTHPRSATDLQILPVEVAAFNRAVTWYFGRLVRCVGLDVPPWLL